MKAKYLLIIVILLAAIACSRQISENDLSQMDNQTGITIPNEYANLKNPLADSENFTERGGEIFQKYCATCHGEDGKGDGPAAASLDPKPGNLVERQSVLSDGYIYWRITEGGSKEPFKSAMPPWESVLTERDIWEIIGYIRSLPK